MTASSVSEAKRCRTLVWIVSLCTVGLMFDGYDLVVYGTVVSTFLRDPSQIAPVDPALAGTLGSYALLGVLVGAPAEHDPRCLCLILARHGGDRPNAYFDHVQG
jgi:MFS transporter, AAHS family, benzoate transport protein